MNLAATLTVNALYRILNMVVMLVIVVLVSKLAGVGGYGILSLMIVNATVFNLVSAFGIDAGITWHSANSALLPGKITTILFSFVLIQLGILGIAELLCYYLTGHYWIFQSSQLSLWWIGGAFLLSVSITEKYTALFNGHHLFTLCGRWLLLTNLLVLGTFSALFFYHPVHSIVKLAILYVLLYLLQSVVLVVVFHRHVKDSRHFSFVSRAEVKAFLSFSFITLVTNFIQFLAYRADYWFIDYYKGKEELGWYSLSVRLVQVFWMLPLLFAGMLLPIVAREKEKYNVSGMLSFIRALFFFNLVAGLLSFFLVEWVIVIIFGKVYENSALLFQILLPGIILFCSTIVLAAWFGGKKQLFINLGGSILCFCSIIFLDILLIPKYGMKGAAIASSIGYSVTSFYFIGRYCRQTGTPLHALFLFKAADWRYFREIIQNAVVKRNKTR